MPTARIYTKEEIQLMSNIDMTGVEICKILGISIPTLCRTRKRLGIVIPRGSKKGKIKPWNVKKEKRVCIAPDCNNEFIVVPSHPKRYCSNSCSHKHMNRSHLYDKEIRKKMHKIKDTTHRYKVYASKVHRLSQKVYEENIDIINPNRYTRTLCGVDGGWQLDHIITIKEGFTTGLSPEYISSVENLRMLPWKTNLMRQYDNNL